MNEEQITLNYEAFNLILSRKLRNIKLSANKSLKITKTILMMAHFDV